MRTIGAKLLGAPAFLLLVIGSAPPCSAQALVPNLGAGGPQLAVLVEEVTRAGAPTGSSMMFPSTPAPLPASGVLPVAGVIGAYTVDLTVTLTTDPAPGIVISGAPGTITKTGSAPTRLHITVDGGLSAPQGADTLAHLALVGDASGECGINFSAAAGYPAGGGDIAWTAFPSGVYLTLYRADPIEEYRPNQPIRQAGVVAIRNFLSTDISTMGDTVTLPASAVSTIGGQLVNAPIPDLGPGSTFKASFDGENGPGGSVCEYDPTKIGIGTFRPGTFDHVLGIADLFDSSQSRGYEIVLSDLIYSATPWSVLGLNWRGFGGLDTVVRDYVTLDYTGGASFDADQLYHHKTMDEIVLTKMDPDHTGFGVATFKPNGDQTGGWFFQRTDGKTFGDRIAIDFVDGSPDITGTADLATDSSEKFRFTLKRRHGGSVNQPNFGVQLIDLTLDLAYFDLNPTEDCEVYKRLGSNPQNPASVHDPSSGRTYVAEFDGPSPRVEYVPSGSIGNAIIVAVRTDANGLVIGDWAPQPGADGETVLVLADGSAITFSLEAMLGTGRGASGFRAATGDTLDYFDFLNRIVYHVEYELCLDIDPPVAEVEVFSTGVGNGFHKGATRNLTYKVEPTGIILTGSPSTSFLFNERTSATIPVDIDTAVDASGAFTFADAAVVASHWTPDATVSRQTQAVDQNTFSGVQIGIELVDPNPSPVQTLDLGIELTGGNSITFTWPTETGKTYTVLTTTDRASGPPSTWSSPPSGIDLESTANTFTFPIENHPFRLVQIVEKDPP